MTPHIERMASMGMRFIKATPPQPLAVLPVAASRQGRHLLGTNITKTGKTDPAYNAQLNIPRMLKAADPSYQTAHFGKWDHRYDGSALPAGYDFSDGYTGNMTGGAKNTGQTRRYQGSQAN